MEAAKHYVNTLSIIKTSIKRGINPSTNSPIYTIKSNVLNFESKISFVLIGSGNIYSKSLE